MPIDINFNAKFSVPRVVSEIYEYSTIQATYTLTMKDKTKISINVEEQVNQAWKYLEEHCAKSEKCNGYFRGLSGNKSLKQWMDESEFKVHLLQPKTNNRSGKKYTDEDLPQANSAGLDIGISIYTFYDYRGNTPAFAAVLLHEIAHCAGASTNPSDARALEAEKALIPCGLAKYYRDSAKG